VLESHGQAIWRARVGVDPTLQEHFQANLTYTLMLFAHDDTTGFQTQPNNQFDRTADWARSIGVSAAHAAGERHLSSALGRLGVGRVLSSDRGNYYATDHRAEPVRHRRRQQPIQQRRRAHDSGISRRSVRRPRVITTSAVAPRNALQGNALHKVDARLTKDIKLGTVKITGIAEVFNVFNHANYGQVQRRDQHHDVRGARARTP